MSGIVEIKEIVEKIKYQCSVREYCQWDIREKLKKRGVAAGQIEKVLAELISEKFVSDERYAAAYARDKSLLVGWGRDKIFFALRRKHISNSILESVWEELDQEPKRLEKMQGVIATKWKSLSKELPNKRVEKTLRFALGRGFRYEQAMRVIEDCKQNLI